MTISDNGILHERIGNRFADRNALGERISGDNLDNSGQRMQGERADNSARLSCLGLFLEGAEVEEEFAEAGGVREETLEAGEEGFLIGLAEGHAEAGEDVDEGAVVVFVAAAGIERDDAFDAAGSAGTAAPIGNQTGRVPDGFGGHETGGPCRRVGKARGDVLADGKAAPAVDAAFTLFEVEGVVRQVPVEDLAAILMEIQSFLSDGGGYQHEGTER